MAILKNLIVNGASRFLQKAYFDDIEVSGTTTISNLSATTLTVSGQTTLNGAADIKNTFNIKNTDHAVNFYFLPTGSTSTSRIYETNPSTGVYWLNVKNNFNVENNLSASNLIVSNKSNFGGKVKIDGDVDIIGNLRWSTIAEHMTIQNLGGTLLVAPTIYQSNNTTINVTAKTNNSVTFTITDSSMITGTTVDTTNNTFISGGANWRKNSLVKVSGKIGECVLGTSDGTITNINVSNYQMTITATIANASNIDVRSYSASEISDFAVMLYKLHNGTNLFPIGIVLTSYGSDRKSYIDVYGGTDANPVARMGNLGGLTYNDYTKTNPETTLGNQWGFYTKQNAFFEGHIETNAGIIGGWIITSEGLSKGTALGASNSIFLTPAGKTTTNSIGGSAANLSWTITSNNTFGVTTGGAMYCTSGKIGGWNITSTELSSGTFADADNPSVFLIPSGSTATANIGGYGSNIGGWVITSRNTFGVNKNGGMYCTSGKIGGWVIDTNRLYNSGAVLGTSGIFLYPNGTAINNNIGGSGSVYNTWVIITGSNFGVTSDGVLYATGANISGTITATDGNIGGWTIGTDSLHYSTYALGASNSVYLCPGGSSTSATIGGSNNISGWTITSGSTFGVTNTGAMYSTSGKIGGMTIDSGGIFTGTPRDATNGVNDTGLYLGNTGISRWIGGVYKNGVRTGGNVVNGLRLAIGENFAVNSSGYSWMSNVYAEKITAYRSYSIYGELPTTFTTSDGYAPMGFEFVRAAAAGKSGKSFRDIGIGTNFLEEADTPWQNVKPEAGISITRDAVSDDDNIYSYVNIHGQFINFAGPNNGSVTVSQTAVTVQGSLTAINGRVNSQQGLYSTLGVYGGAPSADLGIEWAATCVRSLSSNTEYNLTSNHFYLLTTWHATNNNLRSMWLLRGGITAYAKIPIQDGSNNATSGSGITLTVTSSTLKVTATNNATIAIRLIDIG